MKVLVEHLQGKVRVSTGFPLRESAEANTEEEAVASLARSLQERARRPSKVIELDLPGEELLQEEEARRAWAFGAGIFKDDATFDEWQEIIAENRRLENEAEGIG